MVLVELEELLERIFANDIGVEHEERRVVLSENRFGELQGTGGIEGLRFDGELDVDVVLLLILHYVSRKWALRTLCKLTSWRNFSIISGR